MWMQSSIAFPNKKEIRRTNMDKKELMPLCLIALMLVLAVSVADRMPERIIIHWNAYGEPDGYGGRFAGLWLLPIITLTVWALLYVIPRIEVLDFRKNLQDFEKHYFGLRVAFIAFMTALYAVTVAINLGHALDMNTFITAALAGLFYYIGYIMQYVKRNFWVGFRTPWALASDMVWNKTHTLGSILFRAAAVIILAGLMIPAYGIWITLTAIIGATVFIVIYSYWVYHREVDVNRR